MSPGMDSFVSSRKATLTTNYVILMPLSYRNPMRRERAEKGIKLVIVDLTGSQGIWLSIHLHQLSCRAVTKKWVGATRRAHFAFQTRYH